MVVSKFVPLCSNLKAEEIGLGLRESKAKLVLKMR